MGSIEVDRMKRTNSPVADFVVGSGDYLKDRGYANPVEARVKFFMANQIALTAETRKLSQAAVGAITGLKQPDVSRIINGNVKDYSVWRLVATLKELGWDITVEIRRSPEGRNGQITVHDASDEGQSFVLG